ncbi:EamA family transporter [Botrimarina hoheduenensis]|uniref:Aromatic amino acid exporter n=1 Tax=Botrimarina hoheduenensis TaxID=2528000 RepID=A0A5C5W9Y7_9BACT|nr:EamA family transporter [Botrimarina hoheduenensis]TWT47424.1 aromatic amino acid exporter [Botrimarina hoheduenensis]
MESLLPAWLVWALLAAIFAAATAITAKLGLRGVDADVGTLVRTIVVLTFAATIVFARGKLPALGQLSARQTLLLTLSGMATGASWLCYFRALHSGEASRVAVIDKLSVVLVALCAALLLGEKLSATGWCGVALVAVGAYLVAR